MLWLVCCKSDNVSKQILDEESNNIKNYIFNEVDKNIQNCNLIYLSIRQCHCLVENIEFVLDLLKKNPSEHAIVVISPDEQIKEYDSLVRKFEQVNGAKIYVRIDRERHFVKYGNVYITDKYFLIREDGASSVIDLERSNFPIIASRFNKAF